MFNSLFMKFWDDVEKVKFLLTFLIHIFSVTHYGTPEYFTKNAAKRICASYCLQVSYSLVSCFKVNWNEKENTISIVTHYEYQWYIFFIHYVLKSS